MGWFDEDDDESDEEKTKAPPPIAAGIGGGMGSGAGDDNEDEEDPLDAFMKNLNSGSSDSQPAPRSSDGREVAPRDLSAHQDHRHRGHRMDLDDDDDEHDNEAYGNGNDDDTEDEFRASAASDKASTTTSKKGSKVARPSSDSKFAATTKANGILFHKAQTPDDHHESSSAAAKPRRPAAALWESHDTLAGRNWRDRHDVTCSKAVDPMLDWSDLISRQEHAAESSTSTDHRLHVLAAIVRHLQSTIPTPTPVQQQTIPVLLLGHNAVVTAATGQGKTLSYVIPALIKAVVHGDDLAGDDASNHSFLTVVLVPTRELALQVEKAARPLLKVTGIRCKSVIGGKESNYDVVRDLKRQPYGLIVASPGRLVDVTKKVSLNPSIVVLDECDKLLQMGFEEQVRQLLSSRFVQRESTVAAGRSSSSSRRQMVLLSATLGKNVQAVAREWLGPHSVRVAVGRTGQSSAFVTQHVLVLANEQARTDFCLQMVPTFAQVGRTLVFVATRTDCEALAELLDQRAGVRAVTLHGDKHQWDRTSALKDFTTGAVPVLVATDLASRGLDIPQVATVLCVHPAKNLDVHTHRVGRAGRLDHNEQREGAAYTLLTPKDAHFARVLKSAWEREGRPVSAELDQLASSASAKRSRDDGATVLAGSDTSRAHFSAMSSGFGSAPPVSTDAPVPLEKKSRWGARSNG